MVNIIQPHCRDHLPKQQQPLAGERIHDVTNRLLWVLTCNFLSLHLKKVGGGEKSSDIPIPTRHFKTQLLFWSWKPAL